ncbi:MAG: lipoyl(octanoyl) transferase LipB [Rhodococcus sp.]|uniref:lipoyl(octanoyl) transferase LipB n=1 Tax=Rhodococcus sp. TaxID=1831 RepID=UPI00169C1073|nr:lipoyl(octanoyl) transferase LipB [Rhodococcus sp. (in: high G+C Gram-positive bacteria)]NLV78379.1 lipoyl(octanoyl) transferase LipB [Rhodococcus sp. (in: high G+C Gram-positive bacteria)]
MSEKKPADRPLSLVVDEEPVDYDVAMGRMQEMYEERREGTRPDTLWLLSHPSVFTVGARTKPEHLPSTDGIPVKETRRGGQLTYHGPGQIVGYLVVELRAGEGVVDYVREVEQRLVDALSALGVPAERRDTPKGAELLTGVWTKQTGRKIVSIGMRSGRGITTHGFALNVEGDMQPWHLAVACGLPDVQMTNVETELAEAGLPSPGLARTREVLATAFQASARSTGTPRPVA